MRVLVTGGAGYIGSVVVEALQAAGAWVGVADDLSTGHRAALDPSVPLWALDVRDTDALTAALTDARADAVIHMAARSLVGESVQDPARYYEQNLGGALSLLAAMRRAGVGALVLSSTAAVYGQPDALPIDEAAPTRPTNPYGETKLAIERAIHWYANAYGLSATSLRYFNAAGATEAHGEDHAVETHLLPNLLLAALGQRPPPILFGADYPTRDGTCVRDYIHVWDLAQAHLLALRSPPPGLRVFNLGCGGQGHTVREVLSSVQRVTGLDPGATIGPRRPGDPAVLVASSARAEASLGWERRYTQLDDIVGSAWAWHKRHPTGY